MKNRWTLFIQGPPKARDGADSFAFCRFLHRHIRKARTMDNKSANEPITMPTIGSMVITVVVDCTGGVILREMIRCGD